MNNENPGFRPKGDTSGKPHRKEECWNGANAANDPRHKRQFHADRHADNTTHQNNKAKEPKN